MDLMKRMKATQRTVDLWKGRKFKVGSASPDCIQLMKAHARHLGKPIKLPKYSSFASGRIALRSLGFANIHELMDAHFERIETSQVLAGDVIASLGEGGFAGLMIALGNGRALGFHEEIDHCDILEPLMMSGVWRIG